MSTVWFKPKRFGYGVTPATWEGWLVTVLFADPLATHRLIADPTRARAAGLMIAVGLIAVFEPRGGDHYLRVRVPAALARYVISKGSIAIDGVSLTVAEAGAESLAVWLIPHTLAVTALGDKRAGDQVNLEFDLLGKYVEKLLPGRAG